MGQRATFAYVHEDGTVGMTSVQWSTSFHHSLAQELAFPSSQSVQDRVKAIFTAITQYEHISSFETPLTDASLRESIDYSILFHDGRYETVGEHSIINGFTEKNTAPTVLSDEEIYEYHLDADSIGAIFYEKTGQVKFFWLEDTSTSSRDVITKTLDVEQITPKTVNSWEH